MRERLDTSHEILAVANYVRYGPGIPMSFKTMRKEVDGYDVYLPKPIDETAAQYARWLLDHPHPDVTLHFTRADIQPEE